MYDSVLFSVLLAVVNLATFLDFSFAPQCQALPAACRLPARGCRKQSGADVKGVTHNGR